MKFILTSLIAVFVIGMIGTAYSFTSTQDGWSASYVQNDNTISMWVFNPNNFEITHMNPEKEFETERIGNFDVVTHENDVLSTNEYFVNGTRTQLQSGDWIPAFQWLESEITKIWNAITGHDEQITQLKEEIRELRQLNENQNTKIQALERQVDCVEQSSHKHWGRGPYGITELGPPRPVNPSSGYNHGC